MSETDRFSLSFLKDGATTFGGLILLSVSNAIGVNTPLLSWWSIPGLACFAAGISMVRYAAKKWNAL